jgi:hypothetical protein
MYTQYSNFLCKSQTECVADHCATRFTCGNQRMQRGEHAALALRSDPGKGIS